MPNEDLPDGIVQIGEPVRYVLEKVTDPTLLDFAHTLDKQMEHAIGKNPRMEESIREEYGKKFRALMDWYEHEKVRWTIT